MDIFPLNKIVSFKWRHLSKRVKMPINICPELFCELNSTKNEVVVQVQSEYSNPNSGRLEKSMDL